MLLAQTCTILRATSGTKRYGFETVEAWSSIATDIPCRIDFLAFNRSRAEIVKEEWLGRSHGVLFVKTDAGIQSRDIITIDDPSGLYSDKQYDVEFVDPVLDSGGVHHLECSVSLRDNSVDVT